VRSDLSARLAEQAGISASNLPAKIKVHLYSDKKRPVEFDRVHRHFRSNNIDIFTAGTDRGPNARTIARGMLGKPAGYIDGGILKGKEYQAQAVY
jgi:hypothetical protein